jgi:acyl carrier protein
MADTLERVKKVVVDKLQRNDAEITEETSFQDDLGADSLDMVELALGFEEEFGISIPDEDAEKIKTVGDAVKYVEQAIE